MYIKYPIQTYPSGTTMIFSYLSSYLLAIPFFSPRPNTRQYNIFNKCPTAIDLYIGGVLDGNIASAGNVTRFLNTDAGFFYTDANGGKPDGTGTTRAGFFGNVSISLTFEVSLHLTLLQDMYYIVQDRAHINTGLQIKPSDPSVSICHRKYKCRFGKSLCTV